MGVHRPNPHGILLTRRELLQRGGLGAISLLLAACGFKPTAQPSTSEPPTAVKPTDTLPAANVVPTSLVTATISSTATPHLEVTATAATSVEHLPITQLAVDQFVLAIKDAGTSITSEQILQKGLITKDVSGKDGKMYSVASTQDGYPIMMKAGGEWHPTTDKVRDEVKGINLGAFFGGNNTSSADFEKITQIITNKFSLGGVYVGGSSIQPTEGGYKLDTLKWLLGTLKKNNQVALIHPLIWFNDSPNWMQTKSKDQLIAAMTDQITKIGQEVESTQLQKKPILVVVNEANHPRDFFSRVIGPDYVDIAFQTARKAAPSSLLIYNDYNNHTQNGANGERYSNTLEIVNRLKGSGLIDGVGMQMQFDGANPPKKDDVIKAMKSYGIPVFITEFTVNMKNVQGTKEERVKKQAEIYQLMIEAAVESGVCQAFVDFQLGDKFSVWENNPQLAQYSKNADPTPFNDDLNPKLAFYEQIKALLQ